MIFLLFMLLVAGFQNDVYCFQIASQSRVGFDVNRPHKVNQDAVFSVNEQLPAPYTAAVGILDGHGLKGHVFTEYVAQQIPLLLCDPTLLFENNENGIQEATTADAPTLLTRVFERVHQRAILNPNIPASRNGATCIVLLFDDDHVHVAHVGDSRAMVWHSHNDNDDNNTNTLVPLSTETTVNIPEERARIEATGEAQIRGNNVFYGPVGIAMTRALGDCCMLRAGVLSTPVTHSYPRQPGSLYVLGTDGLWDVLSPAIVLALLQQHSDDLQQACDELVQAARQAWRGNLPLADEMPIDGISVLLVRDDSVDD